jgi:soluble lytic murein transglycosylase
MRIPLRLSIILIIFGFCFNSLANDAQYKQVFAYIKQKDWSKAESLAKQMHDRALVKIVLSQEFLDTNYKNTDFNKITNFLKQNPKWPQHEALKARAEGLIDDSTDKAQIYNWFKTHQPATGNGHKYYALAAASIVKDPAVLTPIIKNGWVYGCFGKDEQNKYRSKFKKYLTLEDNVNRVDNLLWKGSTSLAKTSLNLVTPGYKKAFEAHIAFLEMNSNAKKLFRAVPKEYYTQGLVYQYISSRKSDLPPSKEIAGLLTSVKHKKGHEGDFWKVQCYLTREYIQNGQWNDAYLIASNHFAKSSANISDAEFLSGWLALRFLNKPKLAIAHFKKFNEVVKTPMSISRGLYWLGRSYAAIHQDEEAKKLYQHAAHKFGYTFYGQVATMELGETKLRLPPKITLANHRNDAYTKNHDILRAAKLVSKYGSNGFAQVYLTALVGCADEEQEILAIALEMQDCGVHHRVWMSKKAIEKHVFIDHLSFPTPYKTKSLPTEEALTYSIIRQESVFDQHAKSSADAMGLMQLIKPTACETAKKIGVKCDVRGLTSDPNYNIKLGTNHLSHTIQKYQNSYILTIAAYNAGPGNTNKWIGLYGDPRHLKDVHKILDWIEIIPFQETRNYVQRVLENLQIYRAIIHKDGKLKLREDLMSR